MFRKFVIPFVLSMLSALPAVAGSVSDPYTFTSGTPILSSQVNSRFSTLYTLVNGNIDNANIKGSAAIDPSKMNRGLEYFVTRSSGLTAISAGTTGDSLPRLTLLSNGLLMYGTGSATPDIGIGRASTDWLQVRNASTGARSMKMLKAWFSEYSDTYPRVLIQAEASNGGIYFGTGSNLPAYVLNLDGSGLKLNAASSYTISSSSYGDLHINALNLETPLPFAEGGTGGVSGSAGQTVRIAAGGTSLEGYNQSQPFGGGGGDGTVTRGTTSDAVTQFNATSFSQTASTTWSAASGIVINSTGAIGYNGTTTVGNLGNGPTNVYTTASTRIADGCGNGGHGGQNTTNPGGGGGGGYGGAGGNGGDNSNDMFGQGAKAVPLPNISTGGAGGCGGSSSSGALGGNGGSRGGVHRACAATSISFGSSAIVEALGAAGGAGASSNAAGGGGGAGGHLGFYALQSISFGSGSVVRANGGNGGDAASSTGGVGSGGGGGRIIYMSPANTVTTAPVATGGSVGSTGRTTNSTAGSTGVVVGITGVPSMPLIAHIERSNAIAWAYHMKRDDGKPADFDGREIASWFSAVYAKPGKARQLNTALLFGDDELKLQELSVLDCKGLGEAPGFEFKQDIVEGDSSLLPQA